MEIIKIIGVGLLTLIISILLKDVKKEFSIYAVIIGTSIILFLSMDVLKEIINFIEGLTKNVNGEFIKILLKMTGIAILTEYAVSLCKDSGESAIATKIAVKRFKSLAYTRYLSYLCTAKTGAITPKFAVDINRQKF